MPLTIKLSKSWRAYDPDNAWSNTYEIAGLDDPTTPAARVVAETILTAERQLHLNLVNFGAMLISTWIPDGKPYTPTTFVSEPINVMGLRAFPGAEPVAKTLTLYVRKDVPYGRYGKLFYRGVLTKDDVRANDVLDWELKPGNALQLEGGPWELYVSEMQSILTGSVNTPTGALALISQEADTTPNNPNENAIVARAVQGLVAGGVKPNKTNHAYFDKAPVNA